jgi:hypothetical protein
MNRRNFIQTSGLTLGTLALSGKELLATISPSKILAIPSSDVRQLSRNERLSLLSEVSDTANSGELSKIKQYLFPGEAGLPKDLPSPARTLDIRAKILKQKEEKKPKKKPKKESKPELKLEEEPEQELEELSEAESEPDLLPKKKHPVWNTKIQLLNNLGIKISQYKSNPEIKQAVDEVMAKAHERDVEHKLQFGNKEITEEEKQIRLSDENRLLQILEGNPVNELEELNWEDIGPELEEESEVEDEPEEIEKPELAIARPTEKITTRSPSQGRFTGNGINFKHIKWGSLTNQYNEYNDHFHHKIPTLEAFAHLVVTHPKMFDKRLVKKSQFYVNVLEHHKTRK